MSSVISTTQKGYNEKSAVDNWAGEYIKRSILQHKEKEVLDHPAGSVTFEKLDGTTQSRIVNTEQGVNEVQTSVTNADAKAVAAQNTAAVAMARVDAIRNEIEAHCMIASIHTTAEEKAEIEGLKVSVNDARVQADNALDVAASADVLAQEAKARLESLEPSFAEWDDTSSRSLVNEMAIAELQIDVNTKSDKPTITTTTDTALSFEFSANTNTEIRTAELTTISFTFGDGEYEQDYTSGLSFDSGETPTAIDYTDSGILNWVGTDCATSDGLSIFQPSANTHYDIVFYFNGTQFIGLVNGFVPATGNEAV